MHIEEDAHWERSQRHSKAASYMSMLPVSTSFDLKTGQYAKPSNGFTEVKRCGRPGKLWYEGFEVRWGAQPGSAPEA
jgi:hypothetical protein